MLYRRINPQPPLSAFVHCLWYSEGLEGIHQRERLLPNGESGIVIDLREGRLRICDSAHRDTFDSFAPAIFCGARTDSFLIDTSEQERVIGIQFRPGGAFPFLNVPASEVAHKIFALDHVWPGQAAWLREALLAAANIEAMFSILERFLLDRMDQTSALHPGIVFAIGNLARPSSQLRVADVAGRLGWSSRRFLELFREQTGLTPKAFQRVRRFQHVLRSLRAKPQPDENWASFAMRCGYYDQAHFIHDFRSFSGVTPGEYAAIATLHLNHLPML